jgi:hypothetical protein
LLASTLAGVGSWLGGMVGMSYSSKRIKEFAVAIDAGDLLVLTDVPKDRADKIEICIKNLSQIEIEGTESHVPAFT